MSDNRPIGYLKVGKNMGRIRYLEATEDDIISKRKDLKYKIQLSNNISNDCFNPRALDLLIRILF